MACTDIYAFRRSKRYNNNKKKMRIHLCGPTRWGKRKKFALIQN